MVIREGDGLVRGKILFAQKITNPIAHCLSSKSHAQKKTDSPPEHDAACR
jgi:hypothetical protein